MVYNRFSNAEWSWNRLLDCATHKCNKTQLDKVCEDLETPVKGILRLFGIIKLKMKWVKKPLLTAPSTLFVFVDFPLQYNLSIILCVTMYMYMHFYGYINICHTWSLKCWLVFFFFLKQKYVSFMFKFHIRLCSIFISHFCYMKLLFTCYKNH